MDSFNIFFEFSPLLIAPALLLAGFFTYLLYQKAAVFTTTNKKILGALRFLLLFILLILLITPVLRQIINVYEEPTIVIAIDNSTSITESIDSTALVETIKEVKTKLSDNYRVELRTLDQKKASQINFNSPTTNLYNLLKDINNDFENRNLASVILVSDGLFNQGMNPLYSEFSFPVHTLGTGDTTRFSDIGITQLRFNKLSYQGNQIPIQAEITYSQWQGENAVIKVVKEGEVLEQRTLSPSDNNGIFNELFLIDADEQGIQRYEVVLETSATEKNTANNLKTAFVDIVEGKKNILLIAPRPHPDIKALKSAIGNNQNYEFFQYIPVLNREQATDIINRPYDLIIMHQLPQASMNNDPVFLKFSGESFARWWITGTEINFPSFNKIVNSVNITPIAGQTDEVTAWFNMNFKSFNLSEETRSIFNSLPPVKVPFGNFQLNPGANIFLYQQVGNVQTEKPLFITSNIQDNREGIFIGDGLWQWKLYEYAEFQTHSRFNELISKTVQYLSSKEDKRRFRFYTVKNEFKEGEQVIFESEVYNDLYEPVFGQQVSITVTDEQNRQYNYQYVTSENNSRYSISGLNPGVYSYKATTSYNNNSMEMSGEFAITDLDLENLRFTADFDLLQNLAEKSGGSFYPLSEADDLADLLKRKDYKQAIQTSEDFLPLINIEFIGIILLILISIEWVARKYYGSY